MPRTTVAASELDNEALWKFLENLNDTYFLTLMGAVVHTGGFNIKETPKGLHVYMDCPNSKIAQRVIGVATQLFVHLHEVFPITRLFVSTINDPFETQPFDNWISLGAFEIPPDLLLGIGAMKGHPDWHAVIKLDDDGYIVR